MFVVVVCLFFFLLGKEKDERIRLGDMVKLLLETGIFGVAFDESALSYRALNHSGTSVNISRSCWTALITSPRGVNRSLLELIQLYLTLPHKRILNLNQLNLMNLQ